MDKINCAAAPTKIDHLSSEEISAGLQQVREHPDFRTELEYFLEAVSSSVSAAKASLRLGRPLAGLYCSAVPAEIVAYFGFAPLRLSCGWHSVQRGKLGMPATACPAAKACAGAFALADSAEKACSILICADTCREKLKLLETASSGAQRFYVLEVPYSRETETGSARWSQEVNGLKEYLQKITGKRFVPSEFVKTIEEYRSAWLAFDRLRALRREGRIPGLLATVIFNAYMFDDPVSWAANADTAAAIFRSARGEDTGPKVMLTGSPVPFPYMKVPELIEKAGMQIAADQLCTSERLFAPVIYKEESAYGLIQAVAERYELSCKCPVFAGAAERALNAVETARSAGMKGIIYHVLKGCRLFDIESFEYEKVVKENGLRFLRIETDYSPEDRPNIFTRLEAFRATL